MTNGDVTPERQSQIVCRPSPPCTALCLPSAILCPAYAGLHSLILALATACLRDAQSQQFDALHLTANPLLPLFLLASGKVPYITCLLIQL